MTSANHPVHVWYFETPAPCSHPGPCRNTEPRSSGRTNAAASSSWCSAVSSASRPSGLSPDPEENMAWRAATAPRAPCFWTALQGHTHWDQVRKKRGKELHTDRRIHVIMGISSFAVLLLVYKFTRGRSTIIICRSLPRVQLSSQAWQTMHPDSLLNQSTKARPPFCSSDILLLDEIHLSLPGHFLICFRHYQTAYYFQFHVTVQRGALLMIRLCFTCDRLIISMDYALACVWQRYRAKTATVVPGESRRERDGREVNRGRREGEERNQWCLFFC